MEGTSRIIKRFVHATILISLLLLALNAVVLLIWIGSGISDGASPSAVVHFVSDDLHGKRDAYAIAPRSQQLLEQNGAWAMLIDSKGYVAWKFQLPAELERPYSLADVAKFSRSFLGDYPVFTWEHPDGLVVVGYPKGSYAKYQHILPVGWVENLPGKAFFLLAGNIVLALLLSLFIGSRLIASIRPLTSGIQALGADKPVQIEPKGVLANLAVSINHVSALLQQKNAALKARDAARSNWISGVSHDIRTPLSMLLGYASDIADSPELPAEQRRLAAIMRQQAERIRSLVSDLNLVSMLEYEMQPLGKKPLRLSAVARQAASELLNNGLDERYQLEVELGDESPQIDGDERLLLRALANLLQNSIDHNPAGCQLRIQTFFDPGNQACHVVVSDNGSGISPDELPDLLELPYASKRKRPRQNGHGFGLPMAERIAKAHGGKLSLSSEIGKGFCASMELPVLSQKEKSKP
ncbi:HAMP domain-containing sensor histidine kinase [Brevibacillus sp. FSL K6-0770]|uniref:sensor histidine kinase n=1 Tax=Brevibacillus sp. FSL K6-0770 TaxID=2954673 RepID=UPI0030F6B978